MSQRPRFSRAPSWLLAGIGLLLAACQLPAGSPSPDPSAKPTAGAPTASPSPTTGSVQPVITF